MTPVFMIEQTATCWMWGESFSFKAKFCLKSL